MALNKTESVDLSKLKIKEVQRIDYFDTRYYKIILVGTNKKLYYEYFVSVTEILGAFPKKGLDRWRGDVGNDRADQIIIEAFNLGSVIHNGAEVIGKKGAVIYNPISKPLFTKTEITALNKKYKNNICIIRYPKEFIQLNKILKWFKAVNPTKVETELTVYSLKYKYAGTLDLLFYLPKTGEYMINGSTPLLLYKGWYVTDYKTGKGIDKTYKFQLSAYIEAILEERPDLRKEFRGGLIIWPNNPYVKKGIKGLSTIFVDMKDQKTFFNNFLKIYDVYKIDKPVPTPEEESIPLILTLKGGKKK